MSSTNPGYPQKQPKWSNAPTPGTYINSVAISGNGEKTVGGTFFHSYGRGKEEKSEYQNFGTYCYNSKGDIIWKDVFYGWQGVYWVDISQDGMYAASGGWFSANPYQGFIRAYNAETGDLLLDYKTGGRVNKVALSSNGETLVAGAEAVYLFQLSNEKYQLTDSFNFSEPNNQAVSTDLSEDGSTIVFSDYESNIYVFENVNGKLNKLGEWKLSSGGYSHFVKVSADGEWWMVGGADGFFYFFNKDDFKTNQKPLWSSQVPSKGSVYGVGLTDTGEKTIALSNGNPQNPDGGEVVMVKNENNEATTGWTFMTLRNPNLAVFNSLGNFVAVSDGHPDGTPGHFYLLEADTGKCLWYFQTGNMSWPLDISSDGKAIAAGSDDSYIYYFTND